MVCGPLAAARMHGQRLLSMLLYPAAGGDYGPVTLPVWSLRAKVHSSLDTIQSPSPAYEAVKSLSKVVDWPVEAKISKQVREISWLVDM